MNWTHFSRLTQGAAGLITALGLFYLLIPMLVIMPVSFSTDRYLRLPVPGLSTQWYERLWATDGYMTAFANTLIVGMLASLVAAILGTLAALAVVRGNIPFARTLSLVLMSPLIMPQIILAIGVFPVIAGIGILGSTAGVVVVHAVIAMPLVFITVSASLKGYDRTVELAAMTLGADTWRSFLHVTFPMIRLGILVGGIFAFAQSFDEIIIALFLTDSTSVTLPVFMWNEVRNQMDPTIAAASTVAIFISIGMLIAVALLQRRTAGMRAGLSARR